MRVLEDRAQLGVEKYLAPVRNLDMTNVGIDPDESFEGLERKVTPSDDSRSIETFRGRAGRALELTLAARLQPDAMRPEQPAESSRRFSKLTESFHLLSVERQTRDSRGRCRAGIQGIKKCWSAYLSQNARERWHHQFNRPSGREQKILQYLGLRE